MSYAGVQTKALTLLQGMSQFDSNNSAESDFRLLAAGKSSYGILLKGSTGKPGSSGQLDIRDDNYSYKRRDDYTVEIHVFAHFAVDQLATRAAVTTLADAVTAHFDKYPDLDDHDGIIDSRIDVVGEPDEWTVGTGSYWRQVINLEVVEISTVYMEENQSGTIARWNGLSFWDGTEAWGAGMAGLVFRWNGEGLWDGSDGWH
ncbi:hypothetical protein CMI37_12175 [Candidatus Pacearchaeota archaeon]|nr:hypothetical protein [Candidatus Pacearchaeota archaeon]|tara:strand:+ start:13101 stop:13706 length:606 start_codon:yes stop_codon:yes gene_type:complete